MQEFPFAEASVAEVPPKNSSKFARLWLTFGARNRCPRGLRDAGTPTPVFLYEGVLVVSHYADRRSSIGGTAQHGSHD
jgi:hypothetical protein